ncbi:MAG: transglutaminase family protein [Syntrophorhabdaceae bacterium]
MISADFSQLKVLTIVNAFTYLTGILCIVALSGHISFIYPLGLLVAMGLSAYLDLKKLFIPRWILVIFTITVLFYFLIQFDFQDLIGHIMEVLFVLMGIKFLEHKKARDYMQIYALALFVLAGLGLMTLDMAFIAYMLLFFVILSLSSVFLTFYSQDPDLEFTSQTVKTMVAKCLWIPLLAIPLSGLMFIILPRTSYPILTFLNRPDKARSGFTDNVKLGHVSDIQEDERIIFRVTMKKIDDLSLYWRGITLDYFDGSSWKSTRRNVFLSSQTGNPTGKAVAQTVYLEPYENSSLFALDKPVNIDLRRARRNSDFTFSMPAMIEKRTRYTVFSILSETIPEKNIDPKTYLQVPPNISPLIVSLAQSLEVKGNKDATTKKILAHLASNRYKYSLKDLPQSGNPLESFLFESPSGNCEFFASAMAILLRINEIPSRLVGGYRGGYYNEIGNYYLIPQKNAHVWVEAYTTGKGWVRYDPTPASIEGFSPYSQQGILLKAQLFLDIIHYYWYGMILNYNLERQISITRTILSELRRPSISLAFLKSRAVSYFGVVILVITIIAGAIFIIRSGSPREMIALNRFLRKLKNAGYQKEASEGLEELVSRISEEDLQTISREFVREFENIYYTDKPFTSADIKRLDSITARIGEHART